MTEGILFLEKELKIGHPCLHMRTVGEHFQLILSELLEVKCLLIISLSPSLYLRQRGEISVEMYCQAVVKAVISHKIPAG